MLEFVLSGVIAGVSTFIAGFSLMELQKKRIKREIFTYLGSEECAIFVENLGTALVAGAMKTWKTGAPKPEYLKIMGMRIPMSVVMPLIMKFVGPDVLKNFITQQT